MADSNTLEGDIQQIGSSVAASLAETVPETDYCFLFSYTVILPEIMEHLSSYSVPVPEQLGATWNYIDAACQGVTGLNQLFDDKTHRPVVTKTKGLLNLASSLQVITLTTISAPALGPIGFATALGVSFVLSLDEALRQMRRRWNKEYFLVDSLAHLDQTCKLIQNKTEEIEELQRQPGNEDQKKLALKLKQDNLRDLKVLKEHLHKSIEAKLDVDLYESCEKKSPSTLQAITRKYAVPSDSNSQFKEYLDRLKIRPTPSKQDYEKAQLQVDKDSQASKTACIKSASDSLLYGIAFTGTLLLCIPGMQPAAIALISIASALFFIKNIKKMARNVGRAGKLIQGLYRERIQKAAAKAKEVEVGPQETTDGKDASPPGLKNS